MWEDAISLQAPVHVYGWIQSEAYQTVQPGHIARRWPSVSLTMDRTVTFSVLGEWTVG